MKEELSYALSKLENAFLKMKEGANAAKNELEKDGVIQRFEFTVELFWKTLKIFLFNSGIDAKTPKESLKEAFRIGWLSKESVFLNMLEDRNKTSHIYDRQTSEEIFRRIKDNYIQAIGEVLTKLRER